MWWKLGGLALITASLILVLVAPFGTVRTAVSLPSSANPHLAQHVHTFGGAGEMTAEAIVVALILCIAVWIATRIIARHLNSN